MPLPLQVPSALYSLGQGDRLARLVMDFFEGLLVLTIKRLFDTESKKNTLKMGIFQDRLGKIICTCAGSWISRDIAALSKGNHAAALSTLAWIYAVIPHDGWDIVSGNVTTLKNETNQV